MRCFVALDLPDVLRDDLSRLQAGLSVGRSVDYDNLHLTLAFLGELSQPQVYDVAEGLASLSVPPVDLTLRGVDVPGGRAPNLIWIGAEATEALTGLQGKVARIAQEAGLRLERRRFRPHVTLARFSKTLTQKDERGIGEFLALNGAVRYDPVVADCVTLYRSHLRDEGPIYEPLSQVMLSR